MGRTSDWSKREGNLNPKYRIGEPWRTIPQAFLATYHPYFMSPRPEEDMTYPLKSTCPECDREKPVFWLQRSPHAQTTRYKDYDELWCGECMTKKKTGHKWLLPFRIRRVRLRDDSYWVVEHRESGIYITKPVRTKSKAVSSFNRIFREYHKKPEYLLFLLDKAVEEAVPLA